MTVTIPLTTINITEDPSDTKTTVKFPLLPLRKEFSSLVSRVKMPSFLKSVPMRARSVCQCIRSCPSATDKFIMSMNEHQRDVFFRGMYYCCAIPLLYLLYWMTNFTAHKVCTMTRINANISISDSYSTPTNYTIEYQRQAWSKAAHLEFLVQLKAESEEKFRLQKMWINVTAPNSTKQYSGLCYKYNVEEQVLRNESTFTPLVRTVISDNYNVSQCQSNTSSLVFFHFDVTFTVYLLYPDDYSCLEEGRRSTDPRKFVQTLPVRVCCSSKCPNQADLESEGNQEPIPMSSIFAPNALEY